ncbi:hypothetical protein [Nonlabens antarcticus]|uniref:hypothetical protein n=1 Tax=Nonlabens antarcticus TaxID=392714 RepID=UPI001891458C|nr:hypothetical protein [Nonlabens antarcticus]
MDLQTRKIELVQQFLKIESEEVISSIEQLLKSSQKILEDDRFKPMTMKEFNARIDKSMEDSKIGHWISQEDLLEEMKSW